MKSSESFLGSLASVFPHLDLLGFLSSTFLANLPVFFYSPDVHKSKVRQRSVLPMQSVSKDLPQASSVLDATGSKYECLEKIQCSSRKTPDHGYKAKMRKTGKLGWFPKLRPGLMHMPSLFFFILPRNEHEQLEEVCILQGKLLNSSFCISCLLTKLLSISYRVCCIQI